MNEFIYLGLGLEPTRLLGETPLFNFTDAYKLLAFCDEHDVAVLGIEGFKVVGDRRVPDMDCIADFSPLAMTAGELFPTESRKSARDFLSSISDPDTLLEFILVNVEGATEVVGGEGA